MQITILLTKNMRQAVALGDASLFCASSICSFPSCTWNLASNTLFVLVSDNGGNPNYPGNNYPFRGAKGSVYNGGVRGAGFVSGNLIPSSRRGGEYNGQIHVTGNL